LKELQDEVSVIGYPTGGDNISVTQGVVSRIEMQSYTHGANSLLSVQIDAAINPGNSGGPVIQGNKVVGISFQNMPSAENIGYIIPVQVIEHFLKDIELHHKYTGFGTLGLVCQSMENPKLREYFKMERNQTGVLVNHVFPKTKSFNILKQDDVILALDGVQLANDGSIPFRNRGERITFDYLVSKKFIGEKCKILYLREGLVKEVDIEISAKTPLVPTHSYDVKSSYFVVGGFVFSKLVQPFLHEYGEDWYNSSPRKLSYKAIYGEHDPTIQSHQEVVILSHILADELNFGYTGMSTLELRKFNGTKVHNLKHLIQLVETNQLPYLRFDLDENVVIVLDARATKDSNKRILEKHYVTSDRSDDLW